MNKSSNDFHREANSWAYDRYQSQSLWLRRSLLGLGGLSIFLGMSLTANLLLIPLKEKVPYLYAFDHATGEITKIGTLESTTLSANWELSRYFLIHYVMNYEGYDYGNINVPYQLVWAQSGDQVRQQYEAIMKSDNKQSPYQRYAKDKYVTVRVISVNRLNENTVDVKFEKTLHDRTASSEQISHKEAIIKWEYQATETTQKMLDRDPLGFKRKKTTKKKPPLRINNMKKIITCSVLVLSGLAGGLVMAASHPHRIAADSHIKVVQYDPNNVVLLNGQYGYQTQITFAQNEAVQNVSLGDSMAWQAVPVGNNLFIKPIASSKTNMTVITNANSYSFQLDSQQQDGSPTYKLQFVYPQGGFSQGGQANAVGLFDPEKLNWKYSFTGAASLAPVSIFDNGQFTFFKFKDAGSNRMPSVFIVDQHKNETLVNYHMQGSYLVVNSVANQFTLRDGEAVTSVYNNFAIGDWKRV